MKTTLYESLKVIKNTIKLHIDDPTFPYFFIVGAGISCPEVPTANNIIKLCKEHLKTFDKEHFEIVNNRLSEYETNNMKYYSEWIRSAFPNKIDRSNFYKKLILNAKISSANLLLAQILNSNIIANTVFTTNFDDSIKKALNLIGCNHFVSENNMDNLVINNQTKEIQIIHVHGTYNFYDCANLDNEINCVATQTGTVSSSQLLSIFLSNQAPIIVGYSGWENDVIMQSLKERLQYATPLQYIWVCYDIESYNNLPEWLRDNPNIDFVIPQDTIDNSKMIVQSSGFLDHPPQKPVIEATLFFNKLISELEIKTPLIFSNPYLYYSQMIKGILPENEDVLHLRNWARRMKLSTSNESEFEKEVIKLEDALIRNNFIEGTEILLSIHEKELNKTDLEFLYSSLITDFIKKESIIDSFETIYNFRMAAISLIETNIDKDIDDDILHNVLMLLCLINYDANEKDRINNILQRIRKLAGTSTKLLHIELLTISFLSISYSGTQEQLVLLKELLERTTEITDKEIAVIRFNALINLSQTQNYSENTYEIIEEATQLAEDFELTNLEFRIYIAKAFHLHALNNQQQISNWLNEIVSVLKKQDLNTHRYNYTHIAALASRVTLNKYYNNELAENFEETFITFIDNISTDNLTDTEFYDYIICCSNILLSSTKNSIKYTYSQKVITLILNYKTPNSFLLSSLLNALYAYFELPNSIVSNEEKINKLLHLKTKVEYTKIYEDLLYYTILQGYDDIKSNNILKDDIEYIENIREMISNGVEMYTSKNFIEAEKNFETASKCRVDDIADTAKTNLAYMCRRGETVTKYIFEDIIKTIKTPSIFSTLNIILYYTNNNDITSEKYIEARNQLIEFSANVDEAKAWWADENLVGEEESKMVLEILENTFGEPQVIDFNAEKECVSVS